MTLRSDDRILTTHVGSLPRPPELRTLLVKRNADENADEARFAEMVSSSVKEVVRRQSEAGLDFVNDGEYSKFAYSTYLKERLTGFGGLSEPRTKPLDVLDFPGFAARMPVPYGRLPLCEGPVSVRNRAPLERDLANLESAVTACPPAGTFMTAASPGLTASFFQNRYYRTHEEYIAALVDVLREEYEAIVGRGFDLQLDCPDLASARNNAYAGLSDGEFARRQHIAIEAINVATASIPPERMRMHLCWGNYEGPHHRDIPLADVLPLALQARPAAILFEGANPRHEHEWNVFEKLRLPDGKTIVPGVIDSTSNFIEHPENVAQRIERYARLVGRESVAAAADCGFGGFATQDDVDPDIVWAKFKALAEGARLASARLWKS